MCVSDEDTKLAATSSLQTFNKSPDSFKKITQPSDPKTPREAISLLDPSTRHLVVEDTDRVTTRGQIQKRL